MSIFLITSKANSRFFSCENRETVTTCRFFIGILFPNSDMFTGG